MKLKINGFANEFEFNDNKVNILVIKNTKYFSNIIQKLNNRINEVDCDEIFLLNDNDEELKIQKEMCIITDLFNLNFNSKSIIGKVYDKILDNIKSTEDTEIFDLILKIRKYIVRQTNELPFNFIMNEEVNLLDLLKLFHLRIDELEYETILKRIEFLIELNSTLDMFKIIVIPNLKIYLNDNELLELYKYSLYNNVNLLLIEKDFKEKLNYENVLIVDEDFNDYLI
mgnify:CR=1 FL=1